MNRVQRESEESQEVQVGRDLSVIVVNMERRASPDTPGQEVLQGLTDLRALQDSGDSQGIQDTLASQDTSDPRETRENQDFQGLQPMSTIWAPLFKDLQVTQVSVASQESLVSRELQDLQDLQARRE